MIRKSFDLAYSRDDRINRRGEEYNRAIVTVKQRQKEQELMQATLANIMQLQMLQQKEMALMDLVSKIDLQQKLLDNKLRAMEDAFRQRDILGGPPPEPLPVLNAPPPPDAAPAPPVMMGGEPPVMMGGEPPVPPGIVYGGGAGDDADMYMQSGGAVPGMPSGDAKLPPLY